MVTAAEVHTLGSQLQADPTKHANNVVKLLACIGASQPEGAAKAAVQALKVHFVTACDAGDVGRHGALKAPAEADAAADASAVYRSWLQRQYAAYAEALLQLLRSEASAATQVAAFASLMECVRHDAGPASFSAPLFAAALGALLLSRHAQPQVFAALFGRYLHHADVRYHTLKVLARMAGSRAVHAAPAAVRRARGRPEEDGVVVVGGEEEEAEGAGADAAGLAAQDVARNIFDVLAAVSPTAGAAAAAADADADADAPGEQQMTSWCGAAEAGLVVAAADAAASAKLRRKRKAAAVGRDALPGATPVAWANAKAQQRAYQAAWLSFLQLDLPDDIHRKVLLKLHGDVIPVMTDPALLSDFLTHALSRGGLDGMLALHGIFVLVTRHGLEYPAFYARLYQLITPAALRSKHRAQFFKLADVFLASGLVPAYSAAAFAKRFARLALRAPPAAAMLCIAFVHNIVRRHPSCMVLLHKPQRGRAAPAAAAAAEGQQVLLGTEPEPEGAAAGAGREGASLPGALGVDVYDEDQPDPAASRAVESSLWELEALRRHYSPQVSTFVSVLDKDLTNRAKTAEVDLAPLLSASTGAQLSQELTRRLKSAALAFYAQPPRGVWGVGWAAQGLASRDEVEGAGHQEVLPGWDTSS